MSAGGIRTAFVGEGKFKTDRGDVKVDWKDGGKKVKIKTTNENDDVRVFQQNGVHYAAVNGELFALVPPNGKGPLEKIEVESRKGDDRLQVDASVTAKVKAKTGDGRDSVVNGANHAEFDLEDDSDHLVNYGSHTKIRMGGGENTVEDYGRSNDIDVKGKDRVLYSDTWTRIRDQKENARLIVDDPRMQVMDPSYLYNLQRSYMRGADLGEMAYLESVLERRRW